MAKENNLIPTDNIRNLIFTVRNRQVMIDSDLAKLYGVETKYLNRAVSRNKERFPEKFRFQLTVEEWKGLRFQNGASKHNEDSLRFQNGALKNNDDSLRFQNGTSNSSRGGRRYLPYVFTEQGVSMLSAVLKSETAVKISIQIIDAFVEMRKFILHNADIFHRLDTIEKRQIGYQIETDQKFEQVFKALEDKSRKPEQGIFYNGQIFDAYKFVSGLIKSAKESIVLLDNYIDESVLTLFGKNQKIKVVIYTRKITKQLKLDLEKYNAQYKAITVKEFSLSHDRFMIIDNKDIYHFGASLKDLGKKWFAFSKFNMDAVALLGKLDEIN